MIPVERWMLPDGIDEILPPEARQIEHLRRSLLDLFHRWGYDLVIPPLMEFTDSLLVGLGKDIDLLTFKVTDQLSGRSMGIRADMTPQIARIDAHSLRRPGINRLCYAGHVIKAQMHSALDTRNPIQVGVELYGEAGLEADCEVISLLLAVMDLAGVKDACLDLGHVGIYRALARLAALSAEEEVAFFDLLQAKALTEIQGWIDSRITDPQLAAWLSALPRLAGAVGVLNIARESFAGAPAEVFAALAELEAVANNLQQRYPDAQLYFDLSELSGYHYQTGVVFAAFVPEVGAAIARGGRYDRIGEVFGRSRFATGFTADLVAISRRGTAANETAAGIFAPVSDNPEYWQVIQTLRSQGERVVMAMAGQSSAEEDQQCDRVLVEQAGRFQIKPI
jgi:ATP phosphoribosyltransferase regulatory subunit